MSTQRIRWRIFGLSSPAFLASLSISIATWIGTMNHIGASALFALSGLLLLISIYSGFLLWKHRKDEVAAIDSTEIRPSKTRNAVDQPDTRLMESLSRARVGAERLLKLKANTVIEGRLVYTPSWETILDIETTYRSTSERLALARSNGSTEYVAKINSLIKSLQRGKSILDMYRPEKDMSLFKDELDANSNGIIRGVDDIFRFLLEPIADTDLSLKTRQCSPPVIGIDAEDSIIDAPGAKIKNQDIGVKSRKSIVNIPDSEIKDERRGKEDR